MKKIHVKVTYIDELLGTANSDPDVHERWIASNAPDALSTKEEIAAIGAEEFEHRAMTIFPRNKEGEPCTYDYQWRGFFKEACATLRRSTGYKSTKLKAFKKEIDGLVFVEPRMIPLQLPKDGTIGNCQRPLRAQTMQGDRVALANSETVPAGTVQEFDVVLLKDDLEPYVYEWLEYGRYRGTGQWRNSGKGKFVYTASDEEGNEISNLDWL